MIDKNWFDKCCWAEDPYDDYECVIYPNDNKRGMFKNWIPLLENDDSAFRFKAYCNYDGDHDDLYEDGWKYHCYVELIEDTNIYEIEDILAHNLDEALNWLIACAKAIDF